MDWSAFAWFFGGAGATLLGVFAQYWVSTRLEDRRRKAEFYQSRFEKMEPWLAQLNYALSELDIGALGTIYVPDAAGDSRMKPYWRQRRLQMLKDSVDKIKNLGDNPPQVVPASLDPEVEQSLDSIFEKMAYVTIKARTVISEVEEAVCQGLPFTAEWEERIGPPIFEESKALRAEIARLAGLLKDLTLKTDIRKKV
jgi:hypothetical protein